MRLISSITRAALGVLLAIAVLAGVVGGCYWLSLVASLRGLEAGIKERDVVKLDKYIDWPRIREQVRADLQAVLMTQVFKEAKKGEEGGLASSIGTWLAGAVAPTMIDRVVDGFVTPQALVRLLEEKPSSEQRELSLTREGFTDFDEYTLLLGTSASTHPRIRAVLRRDGKTWRVVRVVFPPGEAPWETNATGPQLGSAKEKIAHQSIERLAGVLDIYKLDVGTYPTTEQGLLALVERPSGVTHWNGPYLKGDKAPEDPWGRPFVYHNPSQRPGHEYDLYSLGPTGQPGGTGDAALTLGSGPQWSAAPPSAQETKSPSTELKLVKWSAVRQKCQFSECYRVAYTLRNNYDKSIKLIDASVDFSDLLGTKIFGIKLLEDVRVEPHADASYQGNWEINQFRTSEFRLGEIPSSDVQARLRVRAIVFADNSRFEAK